jgi:hypothetical protein
MPRAGRLQLRVGLIVALSGSVKVSFQLEWNRDTETQGRWRRRICNGVDAFRKTRILPVPTPSLGRKCKHAPSPNSICGF